MARSSADGHGPADGAVERQLAALGALRRQGLIRHVGLSNAKPGQADQVPELIDLACVQNQYNLAHRDDDAMIDELATAGIGCVSFFPLGGFSPLQSDAFSDVSSRRIGSLLLD